MPMLDMPLEELKKYRGTNPCPDDFAQYWEEALLELEGVKSRAELVPAGFQAPFAECFHLYFTGVRGARIHVKFIRPKKREGALPALLMFHGYKDSSKWWSEKLPYAASGFVVAAMDCRGQGGYSEDTGGVRGTTQNGHIIRGLDGPKQDMLMRHIFLDTVQLARLIMERPEVDESRVCVMGNSQGGGLSLACAALEPRICRVGVLYPFLSDYKRVWDMDLAEDAYGELRYYFRQFDPLHEREREIFEKLGYLDVHHLAPRIRAQVLMAITLMDATCPPSTQFAAFNAITAPKEALLYYDYGHEELPGYADRLYRYFMEVSKEEGV